MTPPSAIPILTGERIVLRPFVAADAPIVQRLLQRPEISATTLNVPYPYPEGTALAWIAGHPEQAALGRGFAWAICRKDDGELMGTIGLGVTPRHQRGTLGYWLGVDYWNQGFTTEAARLVTTFGFEKIGLHRIDAACLPENIGSSRVMEKSGLRYEGTQRGYYRKGDRFLDVAWYAAIATDPRS
ncbi:MAG TPA: GNAT family N-acetyltransferase [Thermomicrobiales bacterium]|nr:GNAT family N-acetyltransferase [Thermomicrobiales bacterium]